MEGVEYPEPMSEVLLHGKSFTVAKVGEKIYDYYEYLRVKGIKTYNDMEYLQLRFEEANPELAGKNDSDYDEAFYRYYNENYCDWYEYQYAHLDEFLADYYFFESGDFYLWMYFEKGVEELKYNYTDYNYYVAEAYKDEFGKYPTLDELNQYSSEVKPRVLMIEGLQDFLLDGNVRLKEKFESLDYDYTYIDAPGGHSWAFWDKHIQYVLKWMLGKL
jgi:S-formylglutathione hydrolase FrmB